MHEGIVNRAFDSLSEFRSRHQERMDVHAVRVQRHVRGPELFIVDRYQNQIDIRLGPHRVMGKTSAQDRRDDRTIALNLLNKRIQRPAELLVNLHRPTLSRTFPASSRLALLKVMAAESGPKANPARAVVFSSRCRWQIWINPRIQPRR